MDVSAEQESEIWINRAFGIPSVPGSRREHYPFSKGPALVYRLKLAAVLLNAAVALWWVEEPSHRLSLLLSFWLLFVTCECVYKNYPWREPLTIWMWKLYWAIPFSRVLLTICIALLLVMSLYLGTGCKLTNPLAAVTVGWLCCMMSWPLVRENWHRKERSEDDYDQFSSSRSYVLTLPGPFRIIFATLHSPSLLCLLTAFAATSVGPLFLRGWIADVWTVTTVGLALGCLAVLCCHRLPRDVARTLAAWEVEEATYARKIENCLRVVRANLRNSHPHEGTPRFDRLAVQVPLLMREAKILRNASRTMSEMRTEELKNLTTSKELLEFRERLDAYGPYTTECCVS